MGSTVAVLPLPHKVVFNSTPLLAQQVFATSSTATSTPTPRQPSSGDAGELYEHARGEAPAARARRSCTLPRSPSHALAGAGPGHATTGSEEYGTSHGGGNWRYEVMTAWKRWQDYATMAFGVLLIISPFVFGETSHHLSSIGA